MQKIEVSDRTAAEIELLGKAWRVTPGEAVARVLEEFRHSDAPEAARRSRADRLVELVPVHAEYRGGHVEGLFDPLQSSLEITGGPAPRRKFTSPSAAAIAAISSLNPEVNPNRNGWSFWVVTETGKRLQTIRASER